MEALQENDRQKVSARIPPRCSEDDLVLIQSESDLGSEAFFRGALLIDNLVEGTPLLQTLDLTLSLL